MASCLTCQRPGKCCNYHPFFPNFRLGALDPSVVLRLAGTPDYWVQPLGLIPGPSLRSSRGSCPLFSRGVCSIYEHRPAECRSYFCEDLATQRWHPDQELLHARREVSRAQMAMAARFSAREINTQVDFYNNPSDDPVDTKIRRYTLEELWDFYRWSSRWSSAVPDDEVDSWT
jgi:Putative zinc- or iron-chelating domain